MSHTLRRSTSTLALAFGLVAFLCSVPVIAVAESVDIDKLDEHLVLGQALEFTKDHTGTLTYEALTANESENEWRPVDTDVVNFGLSNATYWYRITLNVLPEGAGSYILASEWTQFETFEVYVSRANQLSKKYELGITKPVSERPILSSKLAAPLELVAGEEVTIYIRTEPLNFMQLPLELWSSSAFGKPDETQNFGHAIYFGLIVAMVLYNLLIFAATKDNNYIYYCLLLAFSALFQAVIWGTAFQSIWPGVSWLEAVAFPSLLALHFWATGTLASGFLRNDEKKKKKKKKKEDKEKEEKKEKSLILIQRLNIAALVAAGLSFILPQIWALLLVLPVGLGLMGIGAFQIFQEWKGSQRSVRYFGIFWGTLCTAFLVFLLQKIGLIQYNAFTNILLPLGHIVEMSVLSLALTERIDERRQTVITTQKRAMKTEKMLARARQQAIKTERNLKAHLEEALNEVEATSRLKSEFLASMSHELRTPLNAIVNAPTLILDQIDAERHWHCRTCGEDFADPDLFVEWEPIHSEDCPDCEEALGTEVQVNDPGEFKLYFSLLTRSRVSAKYLAKLVGELFQNAKKQTVTSTLKTEPVPIGELCDQVLQTTIDLADRKQLRLTYSVYDADIEVLADPTKISQVLVNLVGNAIKFTEEGSIRISVHEPQESDPDVVRFEVTDTGPGIPKDQHAAIFEQYRQTEAGEKRGDSTGLGLAISKRIVESHGGEIKVESEVGVGTTFAFEIPLAYNSGTVQQ